MLKLNLHKWRIRRVNVCLRPAAGDRRLSTCHYSLCAMQLTRGDWNRGSGQLGTVEIAGVENAGVENVVPSIKGENTGVSVKITFLVYLMCQYYSTLFRYVVSWQQWQTHETVCALTELDVACCQMWSVPCFHSRIVHSRLVHPCHFVPRCPLPRFQRPRWRMGRFIRVCLIKYAYDSFYIHSLCKV